jgi:hypothetical protein
LPNGHDKNFDRLLMALRGFRSRHGRWPTRVRILPICLRDLRENLLTPEDFARVEAKVQLIEDENGEFLAEDDTGATFHYGREEQPQDVSISEAQVWLGVSPKSDPTL